MDTLVAGLFVAAFSGTTYVAYRHPQHFKAFGLAASLATVAALAVPYAYEQGLLDGSHMSVAEIAARFHDLEPYRYVVVAFIAYTTFLELLPTILKLPKQDQKKGK